MRVLLTELDLVSSDIVVNREIDKFFYMQKLAEVQVLDDKLWEVVDRLRLMVEARMAVRMQLWERWKKDVRWMATYQRNVKESIISPTRG